MALSVELICFCPEPGTDLFQRLVNDIDFKNDILKFLTEIIDNDVDELLVFDDDNDLDHYLLFDSVKEYINVPSGEFDPNVPPAFQRMPSPEDDQFMDKALDFILHSALQSQQHKCGSKCLIKHKKTGRFRCRMRMPKKLRDEVCLFAVCSSFVVHERR